MRDLRRVAAMQGKAAILIIKFPGFQLECRILPDRGREVE